MLIKLWNGEEIWIKILGQYSRSSWNIYDFSLPSPIFTPFRNGFSTDENNSYLKIH